MMGKLKFYDEGHVYEYNGKIIPSVSELLRFLSREEYGEIDKYILDNAAERGTKVHAATVELDRHGTVECETDIAGYVAAYALFLRQHEVKWIKTEKPLVHPKMMYAGTLDRYGLLDGKSTVLDIKTNAVIKKTLVKAQLNGYYKLCRTRRWPVESLCCLQLMRNGKYRIYPAKIDSTEFMACYALHSASIKKQPRGRIL